MSSRAHISIWINNVIQIRCTTCIINKEILLFFEVIKYLCLLFHESVVKRSTTVEQSTKKQTTSVK